MLSHKIMTLTSQHLIDTIQTFLPCHKLQFALMHLEFLQGCQYFLKYLPDLLHSETQKK